MQRGTIINRPLWSREAPLPTRPVNRTATALFAVLLLLLSCGRSPQSSLQPGAGELTVAAARQQLAALPVPDGAEPAEFADLRSAFGHFLDTAGTIRWVSGAPADAANKVTDLYLIQID